MSLSMRIKRPIADIHLICMKIDRLRGFRIRRPKIAKVRMTVQNSNTNHPTVVWIWCFLEISPFFM